MMRPLSTLVACGSLAIPSYVLAATIYVDDSATTGANNGTSWSDAFTNLHEGLKAAQIDDEVRIGQGTYTPSPRQDANPTISFRLPRGAIVQGGYAGTGAPNPDELNPESFATTLSGDLLGNDGPPGSFIDVWENSYNVVIADATTSGTQLRGVIITGGSADDFDGCMSQDDLTRGGGMLLLNQAQVQLSNVIFEHNQAVCAGGAAMVSAQSSLTLQQCTFRFNRNNMASSGYGSGGAIRCDGTLVIVDCLFEHNGQSEHGAAIASQGPSVEIRSSYFVENISGDSAGGLGGPNYRVVNCTFIKNQAGLWGGAASVWNSTFTNCRFLGNSASCTGFAGAIRSQGNVSVVNCLFSGNKNVAVTMPGPSVGPNTFINSTFVGNDSRMCSDSLPGALAGAGPTFIHNCIFWGNLGNADDAQGAQLKVNGSQLSISNSIIEGWDGTMGGNNNSGDDPQFVDADGPDNQYGTEDDSSRLSAKSPAIDTGDNSVLPNDEFDIDEDGDTSEQIPLDLDLEARFVNSIVDLGPFEFDGEPVRCAADIAPDGGDGTVNVDDLLTVINNWGSNGPDGDINNDQTVGVDDLLAVINAWGPCQ